MTRVGRKAVYQKMPYVGTHRRKRILRQPLRSSGEFMELRSGYTSGSGLCMLSSAGTLRVVVVVFTAHILLIQRHKHNYCGGNKNKSHTQVKRLRHNDNIAQRQPQQRYAHKPENVLPFKFHVTQLFLPRNTVAGMQS